MMSWQRQGGCPSGRRDHTCIHMVAWLSPKLRQSGQRSSVDRFSLRSSWGSKEISLVWLVRHFHKITRWGSVKLCSSETHGGLHWPFAMSSHIPTYLRIWTSCIPFPSTDSVRSLLSFRGSCFWAVEETTRTGTRGHAFLSVGWREIPAVTNRSPLVTQTGQHCIF